MKFSAREGIFFFQSNGSRLIRKWRSSKNSDLPIMNQKKKCITREYPGPWCIEIYYDVIDIKLVTTKGLAFPNKLGSLTDYL